MLTAADLYHRAVDDGNAGRHAASIRLLGRAVARTTDPDLLARIDGTLAYLEAERGDPDRGIDRCRTALAAPGISTHTRAVLTSQLGLIALRRGDLDSAFDQLSASVGELHDDQARLGRVLLNRGLVSLERGHIRSSQLDFEAAADAFDRSGEVVERAKARHNQGYTALVAGDLVTALRLMDAARSVLAELSPVALAVCDSDRAETLRAAGMTTDAVRLLDTVGRTFGSRRLRQMQADAELSLAKALLVVDPVRARAVAIRAARRFRTRGNETSALRADAVAIAASSGLGRPGLRSVVDATVRRLEERGLSAESVTVRLHGARLDVRAGRLADAASALRLVDAASVLPAVDAASAVPHFAASAVPPAPRRPVPPGPVPAGPVPPGPVPVETRLLAAEVGAELALAEGDPSGALAKARVGLDELVGWQSAFGSVDLQSSAAMHGRALALSGIRVAVDSGDPALVFEWSERSRAVTSRVLPLRPPADPELARELTELRALRMLDPERADASREAVLRDSIRRGRWATEGSGDVLRLASLDETVVELRRTDADLVSYLWTGRRLTALVIGRDIRIVDLGASAPVAEAIDGLLGDLDVAAATLPSPIATVVRSSLDERLRRIDDALVAPLRDALGSQRVVITPAGMLSGVPWPMLPSLTGRSLSLPTSATRWLSTAPSAPLTSAGFAAGPGVSRAEEEVKTAAASWSASHQHLDAELLVREEATTSAVARLARTVDVLHLSAHGRHSSENPLFSGVELADGPWFGYDVGQLARAPTVVVLSACELGRSATGWGRESLGMAQAWLHGGARCVIAAPASVNDDAACEVLAAVGSALAGQVPASDALAAATGATGQLTPFQVYGSGW